MQTRQLTEYKFLRQDYTQAIPKIRHSAAILLTVFQVVFIALFFFFAKYDATPLTATLQVSNMYSMFMDVHAMMFVGFGFLMTFLKRYGYSSIGFNFLIAAFVLEWALIVRGLITSFSEGGPLEFTINVESLLVADFCAAAVLISFGAVLGKASLSQLVIMAFFEIILQGINEHVGLHVLKAQDVGESMYVHVFGAYFGLAVSKILTGRKKVESAKEGSNYHSDLFSMIGTVFLWILWPSFNSAVAAGSSFDHPEGQMRAIVNTYLSIAASCITVFIFSMLTGKGRLNMVHVQNATLAGGVAIGAIADMPVQPYGAILVGSAAGILSTVGFYWLQPRLNAFVHDTCGVNNLHGMPGLFSGLLSAGVAAFVSISSFDLAASGLAPADASAAVAALSAAAAALSAAAADVAPGPAAARAAVAAPRINTYYPALGLDGRSQMSQGLHQLLALLMTILIALVGGILTGIIMRLPIFEQVKEEDEFFDDQPFWATPEDYSVKLTEVRTDDLELTQEKA